MSDKKRSRYEGWLNQKEHEKKELKNEDLWNTKSSNISYKNYLIGNKTMGNYWNNTNNPNWQKQMFDSGYRPSMLNDPQRVEEKNRIEDNNSNKDLLK
ncbi:hypothetical protein E9840_09085 [Tissierella creatinini]|nr:hypothetical protein E9840_09085 [Tissierella creatinini]TJX65580.1 hypothetical protein E8P77_09815 [Soehngenia saccharolytica]